MSQTLDKVLKTFTFKDESGEPITFTPGQLQILDVILNRQSPDGKKRIHIMTPTRYGKSATVAAGVVVRASTKNEKWAIVAGSRDKAQIIMDYAINYALDDPLIQTQLSIDGSLERLRRERSRDRLTFLRGGEMRVFSADSRNRQELGNTLMGMGASSIILDEAALIDDDIFAKIMRMLGDNKDNFLVKIGNPFRRNHFLKSFQSDLYYKIFIDWRQAVNEGRFTPEFVEEMQEQAFFDIFYEVKFPEADSMDESGWIPLLTDLDIERAFVDQDQPFGEKRLGVDVACGGRNYSVVVMRAENMAKKLLKNRDPDTMSLVGSVLSLKSEHGVQERNIFVDKVGVGKGTYDRLSEQFQAVVGVNAGQEPTDKVRFTNLRSEMYWRAKEWVERGGKLQRDDDWYQLAQIKYKPDSYGRIKIMSKEEMLRHGIDSPDFADAFVLTFVRSATSAIYYSSSNVDTTVDIREFDPYTRVPNYGGNSISRLSSFDPYPR